MKFRRRILQYIIHVYTFIYVWVWDSCSPLKYQFPSWHSQPHAFFPPSFLLYLFTIPTSLLSGIQIYFFFVCIIENHFSIFINMQFLLLLFLSYFYFEIIYQYNNFSFNFYVTDLPALKSERKIISKKNWINFETKHFNIYSFFDTSTHYFAFIRGSIK